MPNFSKSSQATLNTCHPDLIKLMEVVIEHYDCTIIEGHRDKERQVALYQQGASKVFWPRSKHNTSPSRAVDVAPYPIDWTDRDRFHHFAGYVDGIANSMGISIRWGGDWDHDHEFKDNSFDDLVHFELV